MPRFTLSFDENYETFEEVEASSCRSGESKDSTNKNATNENATNPNDHSNHHEAIKPNKVIEELVFKLDWPTRDEIIVCLNEYAHLLYGQKAEAKEKLMNDNAKLYQVLLNLPLQSDQYQSDQYQSGANYPTESRQSSKVTLDLDSCTRSQIVNALLANHSLLLHIESIDDEGKEKRFKENTDLICKLAKLQISKTTLDGELLFVFVARLESLFNSSKNVSFFWTENADQLVKHNSKLTKEVVCLNQIIVTQKAELAEKTIENSDLIRTINELKKEIQTVERAGVLDKLIKMSKLSGRQLDLGLRSKQTDFE